MPGPHSLDDLELVRQGVPVPLRLALPAGLEKAREVLLIEPEGVPLARVRLALDDAADGAATAGAPVWEGTRPERPFEVWHRHVADTPVTEFVVLVDPATDMEEAISRIPEAASALLVLAATVERDGAAEPIDVAACRRWVATLQEPGTGAGRVALTVVPVAWDHPHRADRLRDCATAYARGGAVIDLTSEPTPARVSTGPGAVLFFTGLSGSGKSTLARAVRNRLLERTDRSVTLLDGDVVRRHLSAGLGFGTADRDTNIRRIGWVAARIAEHGGLAICSPIAPFAATRHAVQQMVQRAGGAFALVHVATPLAECERRDRKGLYARARRGEIPDFTGISSPYEEPDAPDLRLDTTGREIEDLVEEILQLGAQRDWWPQEDDDAG